jgi:hypothetical protein
VHTIHVAAVRVSKNHDLFFLPLKFCLPVSPTPPSATPKAAARRRGAKRREMRKEMSEH